MSFKINGQLQELHDSPFKVAVVATGAGAGIQNLLTKVPGSSRTVLECVFPYSRMALKDYLGGWESEKSVSKETALRMARAARARGEELDIREGGKGEHVIGLGLTAAIDEMRPPDRPKRGDYHFWVAVSTRTDLYFAHVIFGMTEDRQSFVGRNSEAAYTDIIGLDMILAAAGIEQVPFQNRGLTSSEFVAASLEPDGLVQMMPVFIEELVVEMGKEEIFQAPVFWPDGTRGQESDLDPSNTIIFSGSFNPLHHGHLEMARQAERVSGKQVVFEITASHPTKGEVSKEELLRRAEQFRFLSPVVFTKKSGLYVEKVESYPGFTFLIGSDVLMGILNPDYYDYEILYLIEIFRNELKSHFMVAPRLVDGRFMTLDDVLRHKGVPSDFWDLFTPLGSRVDITSRQLRE